MIRLKYSKRISLPILICLVGLLYLFANFFYSAKGGYDLISCFDFGGNLLEGLSKTPVKKNQSVFFVETSCNDGWLLLSARQACSVESVARINPHLEVYVLFPSPIKFTNFSNNRYVKALLEYENVRLRHLELKPLFERSPMTGGWSEAKAHLKTSRWPQSHASDLIRYALLWKYGGIYMDLDVILLKPFEANDLDFSCAESDEDIAAGVMSFSHGNHLADLAMKDLHVGFRGDNWGYNGPGTITRLLTKICKTNEVSYMISQKCEGFSVLPSSAYYPISWTHWEEYFSEGNSSRVMETLNNSKGAHFWNSLSIKAKAFKGSTQPYSLLAHQHCPKVYQSIPSVEF